MRHASSSPAGPTPWDKVRVLVFSEDEPFRFLVRATFRRLGVREVQEASHPDQVAALLQHHPPQVAVIDIAQSPQDSFTVLAALRARPDGAHLPVLAAVAAGDRAMAAQAAALKVAGLVPKPVSGHELALRVGAIIARPAAPKFEHRQDPAPLVRRPGGGPLVPALPDAPPPPPPESAPGIETIAAPDLPAAAPVALVDDTPPPRKKPIRSTEEWMAALEEAGHQSRTGQDVAKLDISAIVAEHALWLQSKGREGRRAIFDTMDLAGVEAERLVLASASFREADLSDGRLAGARLDGGDFRRATLSAADLGGADLGVASLRHANLSLANLQGAILRGADLSGAVLAGGKLTGADLKGAILVSTDLRDTDLSEAENLSQPQLDKALADAGTKLPPGLSRPRVV